MRPTEKQMQMTRPGMVHWVGTGPAGKQCWQCHHFGGDLGRRPLFLWETARCDKATQKNGGRKGPRFLGDALACSHFSALEGD